MNNAKDTFAIPEHINAQDAIKAVVFVAWQACGNPVNMGWLQDNPTATADDVFANAVGHHDYISNLVGSTETNVHTDYVFGRMMKTSFKLEDKHITISPAEPRLDYQGWGNRFANAEELFNAAMRSIESGSSIADAA